MDKKEENQKSSTKTALAAQSVFKEAINPIIKQNLKSNETEASLISTTLEVAGEKAIGFAKNSVKDVMAITATQPAVAALIDARGKISKDPQAPLKDHIKESFVKSPTKILIDGFSSEGVGKSVFQRRLACFVGVSGVGDSLMSDVLPSPEGIKSPEDVATVATRSFAKSGLETGMTINNEANLWHKFFKSKEPITQYKKGLIPGALTRNGTVWLGVEIAKAVKNEDPSQAVFAGAVLGVTSGFAAGMIDNYVTLAKAAAGTATVARPASTSAVIASGTLRALQAGVTTAALVGFSSLDLGIKDEKNASVETTKAEPKKQGDTRLFSDKVQQAAKTLLTNKTSSWQSKVESSSEPKRGI